MAQMASVGEIQTHQPIMRSHDGLVCLEVGRATAQALHIDTPLLGVQTKSLEGPLLAKQLDLVDVLVTSIVAGAGVTLGVLV